VRERRLEVEVDGRLLSVANLDKVLYPASGFTKGDLISYYVAVAPAILGHLAGRPVTLARFPDGVEGRSFLEKHVPAHAPAWLETVEVPRVLGRRTRRDALEQAVVSSVAGLVWAANLAAIELHVPMWRVDTGPSPRPDLVVFDLDPGPGVGVLECIPVAVALRRELEARGLEAVPKTSGRKGLHLYARLEPPRAWQDVRSEAYEVARRIEAEEPRRVVTSMARARRPGRVLIDWSQNHPAKTTVAAYSLRAEATPSVSAPLRWEELAAAERAGRADGLRFRPAEVLARLDRYGDLFAGLAVRS